MGSHQKPFERAQFDLILDQGGTTTDAIRCLSDLIHFNAIHNPRHVFCVQSRQSTACDKEVESVKLTFHELAHAVEQCCRWILSQVSGSHPAKINRDGSIQKSQPVALFLESDLTLFVYLGALLTLNIPVSHISPYIDIIAGANGFQSAFSSRLN